MKKMNKSYGARRIAALSLTVAFALMLSYIESLLPAFVPIPGVKIGLANVAVVFVMFTLGAADALTVSLIRVLLVSMLFGSPVSAFYSILGAVFSFAAMLAASKISAFSLIGISVAGGVFHNVGQIIAAAAVLGGVEVLAYLPVLIASGTVAGVAVGAVSSLIILKLKNQIKALLH